MTNLDLDQLEQRHAKTSGPWTISRHLDTFELRDSDDVLRADRCGPDDALWIIAIHNAAPALIAEVREARAAIERVLELAARWDCAGAMTPAGPGRRATAGAVRDLREALDGAR